MRSSIKSVSLALSLVIALGATSPIAAAPKSRSIVEQQNRYDFVGLLRRLIRSFTGSAKTLAEPTVPIPRQ
ncbi:MAG TPA: hypothetical protein VF618_24075 [Thermoanaerobaculia bacterium]